MTFVDNPVFDEGPIYDESEGEEEDADVAQEGIIYADSGESLVVRRILNVAVADDESWLRHNVTSRFLGLGSRK